MNTLRLSALTLGILLGGAADAAPLQVPLEFSGTFRWEGENTSQAVNLHLSRATRLPGNELLLEGTGFYDGTCSVLFRSRINRLTLKFTQTESLLVCPDGVDQGQYRGQVSSNFKRFEATWTGRDGNKGILNLNASSSAYVVPSEK